jgi:TPR repeat protein
VRIWRRLAEAGHVSAQNNMAAMYEQGRGVPQDNVQALMWWIITAQRADTDAYRRHPEMRRDALTASLAPAQVAEAQRLAREWDAAHPPGGR